MGQLIIIPGRGETTQNLPVPEDIIAYYRFEEAEDQSIAIDWAKNFDGTTPEKKRTTGYINNGLPTFKDKKNFNINMLLDEIPSSLTFTVEFFLKLNQEFETGEHGTYTLFSKQWASGMRLYAYFITRLETIQFHLAFAYLVKDTEGDTVQVKGATDNSLNANGIYRKISDILYQHAVYSDWRIYFDNSNSKWNIQNKVDDEWITHFISTDETIEGGFTTTENGAGTVEITLAQEIIDIIQIDDVVIPADRFIKYDIMLKLQENLPSSFGVRIGDYYEESKLTTDVVDIPINTEIDPVLIGGDLSDVKFCENDPTIPYIVDGNPLPSSYRYGIDGILDEVKVWRTLQYPVETLQPFTLTVEIAGNGSVDIDPEKDEYKWKEEVELTAIPDEGEDFIKWSGDVDTTENPITITMTKDMTVIAVFTGKCATPKFSPDGGTYDTEQSITITCDTPGAVIHYTTDGSDPDESDPTYSSPVSITQNTTLKARAYCSGYDPSNIKSATYYLKVKTPNFSPQPGGYPSGTLISISCGTTGATLRYTTDGSTPTESSPVYTNPIELTQDFTLKAKGWKTNWLPSDVKSGDYQAVKWYQLTDLPPLQNPAMFAVNNKIYVVGGLQSEQVVAVIEYNPSNNTYTRKNNYNFAYSSWNFIGCSYNGYGYISVCCPAGNVNESIIIKEKYNTSTDSWESAGSIIVSAYEGKYTFFRKFNYCYGQQVRCSVVSTSGGHYKIWFELIDSGYSVYDSINVPENVGIYYSDTNWRYVGDVYPSGYCVVHANQNYPFPAEYFADNVITYGNKIYIIGSKNYSFDLISKTGTVEQSPPVSFDSDDGVVVYGSGIYLLKNGTGKFYVFYP